MPEAFLIQGVPVARSVVTTFLRRRGVDFTERTSPDEIAELARDEVLRTDRLLNRFLLMTLTLVFGIRPKLVNLSSALELEIVFRHMIILSLKKSLLLTS